MSCDDENLVDYFLVATKRPDGSPATLSFVYPPVDDDPEETDFCENVTMFTYPHGYADSWDGRSLPPPPAHNLFTLTDAQGDHLFGASVSFFESNKHVKSLCVLSRRPFYTQMLRYLEQLLLLGLWQSKSDGIHTDDVVEKTLCNLFHEVPVPYRGLAVQMQVGELEIVLERAPFLDFPFEMDPELMYYTFMMIDPKVLLQLYHHVLLEHRVLIIGNDSVLVTAVVETLKSLVFPFTWLHVVIPNIPDSLDLDTLLDAPVPFLAGANAAQLKHVVIPSNVVKYDLNESRLVVQTGSNNSHQPHQQDLESVVLPTLPDASTRLLQKLTATRLPDLHTQKKELHQRLWDRRIQLQKCCMGNGETSVPVITPKSFFLVKQSLVHKKMMKLYLELVAVLLQDFPLCISHQSKQFENGKFVDKKPTSVRAFYRAMVEAAQFQSFIAQHNDYVAGQLGLEEAMKFLYVHKTLLSAERLTGNQADASAAVALALTKTFVATTPEVSMTTQIDTKASIDVVFPPLNADKFGQPRQIQFPRMSMDAVHSSLGTFLSPSGVASRRASKDTSDWMQAFLRTVPSLPTTSSKQSDPLASSSSRSGGNNTNHSGSEKSKVSIFGSSKSAPAIPLPRPAPFKRSRTIDRLKSATPFYRTMTQKALDSTLSSLASAAAAASNITQSSSSSGSHSTQVTRPAPVIRSIWLITVGSCKCRDTVVSLTEQLVEQLQQHDKKTAPEVAEAYCKLIDTLAACGHPSEAKAVFEECLSGSSLLSLETIAARPHFWKPFSTLLKCYITNGLVQRAFDLLVQVRLDEEQLLDPSLGVLHFNAQVFGVERQVMVERIYVTFSSGNLGLCLAPRVHVTTPFAPGSGCELISFPEPDASDREQAPSESVATTSGIAVHDIIESINGELFLHHPFPDIITALKQASRPMTVTFVRGSDRLDVLHDPTSTAISRRSSSSASATSHSSTAAVVDGRCGVTSVSTTNKPRRDLCDRYGLLPTLGIRVTTLADCSSCGKRLTLSQVQSGWSATDASDYTTRCCSCHHRFVPKLCVMLGVMTTHYRPQRSRRPDVDHTQLPHDAKVEQFEYLSMPVIRKELHNLAQKVPLTLLSMKDLREMKPRIYWNIVVKLLSLDVPLEFMQLPDMTKAAPAKSRAVANPSPVVNTKVSQEDEEMRVLRDMVLSRAAKLKGENQKAEDVLSSVLKALEQQAKQELQAQVKTTLNGSKGWSLLGRLYPSTSSPRIATPTQTSSAVPTRVHDDRSDDEDEDERRQSSGDDRETDIEDTRSSRTISVNESMVSDEGDDVKATTDARTSRSHKFMPSLSSAAAPFSRITRTTTHY